MRIRGVEISGDRCDNCGRVRRWYRPLHPVKRTCDHCTGWLKLRAEQVASADRL